MRFLKTKIDLARKALEQKLSKQQNSNPSQTCFSLPPVQEKLIPLKSTQEGAPKCQHLALENKEPSAYANTKNISINFGRAFIAFTISPLAKPYLQTYFQEDRGLLMSEFLHFLGQSKYKIKGIDSLRNMLLVKEKDSMKETAIKRAFQWISQIFIKYFSVNWIMHGKMAHKMTYLKYRSKMLRRIQNPELFTYVREQKKKGGKTNNQ